MNAWALYALLTFLFFILISSVGDAFFSLGPTTKANKRINVIKLLYGIVLCKQHILAKNDLANHVIGKNIENWQSFGDPRSKRSCLRHCVLDSEYRIPGSRVTVCLCATVNLNEKLFNISDKEQFTYSLGSSHFGAIFSPKWHP